MTDERYTFLPLYDAEVDEDKMQKNTVNMGLQIISQYHSL